MERGRVTRCHQPELERGRSSELARVKLARSQILAMGVKVTVRQGLDRGWWFACWNTLVVPPDLSAAAWEHVLCELTWSGAPE